MLRFLAVTTIGRLRSTLCDLRHHLKALTVLFVFCCVLELIYSQPLSAQSKRRPNIIFIMADDLGYGDLGCYGQKRIKTPHIDSLAAEGVRFTDFYAGSTVCAPSRCVLMTGLHTGHCFIRGNGKLNLRPTDQTVAKILKKAGYRTGLFGKWGLGHEGSTGIPTKQGFEEFYGYLDQHHAHNYYPRFLVHNEKRVILRNVVPGEGKWGQGVASKKLDYSHDLITQKALEFIDQEKEKPFFLYFSATIPHANNEARGNGMEVPDFSQYASQDWPEPQKRMAAMVSRLDRDIGRILQKLKEHKIDENTIVFFTSDNGPHREGGNNPEFFDSNGPLRGIKRALYDGGIRVPMIVRWPGKTRKGSISDFAGYFADLMPTAAEIAGSEANFPSDGLSFLPAIIGQKQKSHPYLYWEFYEGGSAQAVRMGKWKAVRKPMFGEKVELFDVTSDIGEKTDLASKYPEVVGKALQYMKDAHRPSTLWTVRKRRNRKPKKK